MKPIVSTKIVSKSPQRIHHIPDIHEFYKKRNRILIIRNVGGLGDILMHRMLFEDIKLQMPDAEVHFACPRQYHDAVRDHPFLDKLLDCQEVNKNDYIISFNTSSACGRYESALSPLSDLHRSDIWAKHCGFNLTHHNMHLQLTDEEKAYGKKLLESHRDRKGPIVVFCPISAQEVKNLSEAQQNGIIDGLHDRNCCVIGLHVHHLFNNKNTPSICEFNMRNWMSVIYNADYVVSVDTAAFHCAGGFQKPLTGIFTFADGKVYGKYFKFVLVQKHRDYTPGWTCGPCYSWARCPKTKEHLKPCLTEITPSMVLHGIDQMLKEWPIN